MRTASIALLAVLILTTVWWFVARRSYSTPSAYGSAGEQAGIAENIVRRGVLTALSDRGRTHAMARFPATRRWGRRRGP